MVNSIRTTLILALRSASGEILPSEENSSKRFARRFHLKPSRKTKGLIAVGVIAIILVSCFVLIDSETSTKAGLVTVKQGSSSVLTTTPSPSPTPKSVGVGNEPTVSPFVGLDGPEPTQLMEQKSPGLVESNPQMNNTVWKAVAANAWAYFQPGVGVDKTTGLPYAGGTGFEAFTDWDLSIYIQAIIDAQELGLNNATGSWGSNYRIDKVLTFLDDRPLNTTTNWPFWFYDATNGQGYEDTTVYASDTVNVADTGALFVALSDLAAYNSSLTQQIDNIVLNGRSSYASLLPGIESSAVWLNNVYYYYIYSGFAAFWPKQLGSVPQEILNNILSCPTITTYGITLPDAPIDCEPLLLAVFELQSNNTKLSNLMRQTYLAQEAYFNVTGEYYTSCEGTSPYNGYVYQWVVGPNGSAWETTNTSMGDIDMGNPVIFTKIAFSYLALYNTTFAREMTIYLEESLPNPTNGYFDGVDTAGNLDAGCAGSETNGLILDAALYHVQNNPGN